MIDYQQREQGVHVEIKHKNINHKIYKITETTIVGKFCKIINFVREYDPPLIYKHGEMKEIV